MYTELTHGELEVGRTMSNEVHTSDAAIVAELLRCLVERGDAPNGLSAAAMAALTRAIGTSCALVYSVSPTGLLCLVGTSGIGDGVTDQVSALVAGGRELASTCAARRVATTVALGSETAREDRDYQGADHLHALPLCSRGEINGVLVFTMRGNGPPLGEQLDLVVSALILALDGTWTRRRAVQIGEKLDRTLLATRELTEELARVPLALASPIGGLSEDDAPFDLREYLTLLAERARDLVGAEMVAAGVGTSPEHVFEPWVAVGAPGAMAKAIGHPPRPVGTLGAVAIHGKTVRVRDVHKDPSFVGLPSAPCGHP